MSESAHIGHVRTCVFWRAHLGEKVFGGHRLQNQREKPLPDVDLASPNGDANSGQALQMKVVAFEPCLGSSNVPADGRSRGAELYLEVADVDRARRRVQKGGERMELAVLPVEDPWASRGAETQEDRLPPIVVTGHPDTYTAASHHAETFGAEEGLDRRKVVADDATGQLELARDRLDGRRSGLGQQHACDARLPAIERNDDRHRAPTITPLFPRPRAAAPRERRS